MKHPIKKNTPKKSFKANEFYISQDINTFKSIQFKYFVIIEPLIQTTSHRLLLKNNFSSLKNVFIPDNILTSYCFLQMMIILGVIIGIIVIIVIGE